MIYTCWNCLGRINERTINSKMKIYKIRKDDDPEIGKYISYDHKAFCSASCVEGWKCRKTKPKYITGSADWYLEEWKKERKIIRPKRLKRKKI